MTTVIPGNSNHSLSNTPSGGHTPVHSPETGTVARPTHTQLSQKYNSSEPYRTHLDSLIRGCLNTIEYITTVRPHTLHTLHTMLTIPTAQQYNTQVQTAIEKMEQFYMEFPDQTNSSNDLPNRLLTLLIIEILRQSREACQQNNDLHLRYNQLSQTRLADFQAETTTVSALEAKLLQATGEVKSLKAQLSQETTEIQRLTAEVQLLQGRILTASNTETRLQIELDEERNTARTEKTKAMTIARQRQLETTKIADLTKALEQLQTKFEKTCKELQQLKTDHCMEMRALTNSHQAVLESMEFKNKRQHSIIQETHTRRLEDAAKEAAQYRQELKRQQLTFEEQIDIQAHEKTLLSNQLQRTQVELRDERDVNSLLRKANIALSRQLEDVLSQSDTDELEAALLQLQKAEAQHVLDSQKIASLSEQLYLARAQLARTESTTESTRSYADRPSLSHQALSSLTGRGTDSQEASPAQRATYDLRPYYPFKRPNSS